MLNFNIIRHTNSLEARYSLRKLKKHARDGKYWASLQQVLIHSVNYNTNNYRLHLKKLNTRGHIRNDHTDEFRNEVGNERLKFPAKTDHAVARTAPSSEKTDGEEHI